MEAKFKIDDAVKFTNTVEDKYTIGDEGRIDIDGVFERNGKFFYNVKSAGKLVSDVPEDDIDFVYSSVERNIDEVLRKKEEKRSFKDSDVRVSGSRKEMMAYKGLINSEDLQNIEKDKVIAKKLVNKDKVYPEINTNEQIDKGVSGGTLFLKMKLREFVHKIPPDTAEFRALYVGLCQWLYELFDDAITVTDFEARRKLFINGVIRKAILISNPELENELILQNKEYEQEAQRLEEYRDNYNKAHEKLYKLANEANVPTWSYEKMQEAFPEAYKELQYWKKLMQVANQFSSTKILPLEFRFLHNLAITDKDGDKMSLLTQKSLPQGEIGKSKQIDDEYVINYSSNVRNELIKAVLGDKFYYFIKQINETKSVKDALEDYKKYEPFTQEQYDAIYEKEIKYYEDKLLEYETHISFLNDPEKTYREKVDYALAKTDIGGWYWTNNKRRTFRVMVSRGDIDDAIKLMNSVISKPDSGYHQKVEEYKNKLDEQREKYQVRENNYSFLEKEQKERKKGERTELIVNSGVPLSYIKRVGGVAVYDSDLDTNDKILSFYKDVLGITRITYGIVITDKERVSHAKHFAQSIIDMAEVLNWDVKSLTSLGDTTLGIMFAASGRGKAAAHYAPDTNAINLTRRNGDGSVLHEMIHFIDHALAEKFPKDGRSEKNHSIYGSYIHSGAKNISNDKIMSAMQSLMDFIVNGVYVTKNNEFDDTKIIKEHPLVSKLLPLFPEFVQSVMNSFVTIKVEKNNKKTVFGNFDSIDSYIKYINDRYPKYLNYNYYLQNKTEVLDVLGAVLNEAKLDSYGFQLSNKPYSYDWINNRSKTSYYLRNKALKSPYWTFYWELLARAGESVLKKKMESDGKENNYLVSGANFDRPEGIYLFGIELDIVGILMQHLFDVIKSEMNIPDFKPFRSERVDDYVVLSDKDDDTEEEYLVIDEQTKEVVDGDAETMKQKQIAVEKMIKLKELLSKSLEGKFEYGGQINIDENRLVESLFSFSNK